MDRIVWRIQVVTDGGFPGMNTWPLCFLTEHVYYFMFDTQISEKRWMTNKVFTSDDGV